MRTSLKQKNLEQKLHFISLEYFIEIIYVIGMKSEINDINNEDNLIYIFIGYSHPPGPITTISSPHPQPPVT